MCDVVRRAQELGVYTVVTDWYQNSPAKVLADKAYDLSISDMDAMLELIKEERIDGVFTGFIDSYLPHYYELCKRANLPCYLNDKMLACSTDKQNFKNPKIIHIPKIVNSFPTASPFKYWYKYYAKIFKALTLLQNQPKKCKRKTCNFANKKPPNFALFYTPKIICQAATPQSKVCQSNFTTEKHIYKQPLTYKYLTLPYLDI